MKIISLSRFTKKRLPDNTHIYCPIVLHQNNYWYCESIRVESIKQITPENLKIKRIVPENYYSANKLKPIIN